MQKVFPELTSASLISVALLDNIRRPACDLVLKIDGKEYRESNTTWASEFASVFIKPAGDWAASTNRALDADNRAMVDADVGGRAALRTWNATLNRLVLELDRATTVTTTDGVRFDLGNKLYRGMETMAPVTTDEEVANILTSFSTVYTSASSDTEVALRFSGAYTDGLSYEEYMAFGAQRDDGRDALEHAWFLMFTVSGQGVRYIDVAAVLPKSWLCFAQEGEIILAPGAFYALDKTYIPPHTPGFRLVHVEVTAAHRKLPDTVLLLPAKTKEASELLIEAAKDGREALVRRLLDAMPRWADPNYRETNWSADPDSRWPASMLWNRIVQSSLGGMTALAWAVHANQYEIVRALVDGGATVDLPVDLDVKVSGIATIKQGTALMLASTARVTNVLIAAGADVNANTADGAVTPLTMATRKGSETIVMALLKNGAEVDGHDSDEKTALHHAVGGWMYTWQSTHKIMSLLVGAGANVNATDAHGFTPLMLAASVKNFTSKQLEVVKFLLGNGANRLLVNEDGDTAAQLADSIPSREVVRLLRKRAAPGTRLRI